MWEYANTFAIPKSNTDKGATVEDIPRISPGRGQGHTAEEKKMTELLASPYRALLPLFHSNPEESPLLVHTLIS